MKIKNCCLFYRRMDH